MDHDLHNTCASPKPVFVMMLTVINKLSPQEILYTWVVDNTDYHDQIEAFDIINFMTLHIKSGTTHWK